MSSYKYSRSAVLTLNTFDKLNQIYSKYVSPNANNGSTGAVKLEKHALYSAMHKPASQSAFCKERSFYRYSSCQITKP